MIRVDKVTVTAGRIDAEVIVDAVRLKVTLDPRDPAHAHAADTLRNHVVRQAVTDLRTNLEQSLKSVPTS